VIEVVRAGADLVTFSGDKLLGGPQAGIIVGRSKIIQALRANPLNRALRIDKLTLAALTATLDLYWDPQEAVRRIPTLRMMTVDSKALRSRAGRLARRIRREAPPPSLSLAIRPDRSQVGGGALPLLTLPTWAVGVRVHGVTALRLENALRRATPPVIARIAREEVLLDVRAVEDDELPDLARIVAESAMALTEWHGRGEA
jgi:L-seryl-tRNA(Ser) seleniumtransferase